MQHTVLARASALSDVELLRKVPLLAGQEREVAVELIGHLAELEARKLHLAEGYGSLFSYCTRALRLGEHAAYNRIEAARLCRRFPAILDLLTDGSLNLSTLRLIGPHLRPHNFDSLVAQARGRSKREVEELVARIAPRPDLEGSIRKLPAQRAQTVPSPELTEDVATVPPIAPVGDTPVAAGSLVAPTVTSMPVPATHRPQVCPSAPERYRVQFTVDGATYENLRLVQDLLRREIPDGDPAAIFGRALKLLLEDLARKKLAAASTPRNESRTRTGSRHIPAAVKRAVWIRDGGKCALVGRNGRRCCARTFLEFHHREPYAIGGDSTVVNISVRCRAHNAYESELVFGPRGGQLAPGRVAAAASRVTRSSAGAAMPRAGP